MDKVLHILPSCTSVATNLCEEKRKFSTRPHTILNSIAEYLYEERALIFWGDKATHTS